MHAPPFFKEFPSLSSIPVESPYTQLQSQLLFHPSTKVPMLQHNIHSSVCNALAHAPLRHIYKGPSRCTSPLCYVGSRLHERQQVNIASTASPGGVVCPDSPGQYVIQNLSSQGPCPLLPH